MYVMYLKRGISLQLEGLKQNMLKKPLILLSCFEIWSSIEKKFPGNVSLIWSLKMYVSLWRCFSWPSNNKGLTTTSASLLHCHIVLKVFPNVKLGFIFCILSHDCQFNTLREWSTDYFIYSKLCISDGFCLSFLLTKQSSLPSHSIHSLPVFLHAPFSFTFSVQNWALYTSKYPMNAVSSMKSSCYSQMMLSRLSTASWVSVLLQKADIAELMIYYNLQIFFCLSIAYCSSPCLNLSRWLPLPKSNCLHFYSHLTPDSFSNLSSLFWILTL